MHPSATSSQRRTPSSSLVNLERRTVSSPKPPAFIEQAIHSYPLDDVWLNLSNQRLSPDHLHELCTWLRSSNPQVPIKINLAGNKFDDECAEQLAVLLREPSCITVLDLSGCHLSVEGIARLCSALHENTTLSKLGLGFNPFMGSGEAIASMLSVNKTLTSLGLRGAEDSEYQIGGRCTGRQLGDESVHLIAQALEENSSLETLDLNGNRCGDKGLSALAGMLKINKTLTDLNLRGVGIEHGFTDLCKVLESNEVLRRLHLGCHTFKNEQIDAMGMVLAKNQTLQVLNLAACAFSDEQGIGDGKEFYEGLKANTGLRSLTITNGGTTSVKALATLLKNPKSHIEFIEMRETELGNEDLSILKDAMETNGTLISFKAGLDDSAKQSDLSAIENATARNRARRQGLPSQAGQALYALLQEAFKNGNRRFLPEIVEGELVKAFEALADVPAMLNTVSANAE